MFKQSILDLAPELSQKCSCGNKLVVEITVRVICSTPSHGSISVCTPSVDHARYIVKSGEQLALVINADKAFNALDVLGGVSNANKSFKGK